MKRDGGQATVELALVLPVFLLMVLGLVQVGRVTAAQLAVTEAAREGARAASVDARPDVATAAAHAAVPGLAHGLSVTMSLHRSRTTEVTVTVAYDVPPISGLPGLRRVTVRVRATSTMVVESGTTS